MDAIEIDIPFEYEAFGTRRRTRTPRRLRVRSTVKAAVPALSGRHVPMAVARGHAALKGAVGIRAFPVIDGRPFPFHVIASGPDAIRVTPASYPALVERCLTETKVFDASPSPFMIPDLDRRGRERVDSAPTVREEELVTVESSDREARAALAAVDAASLAFVDGVLFTSRTEPAWQFHEYEVRTDGAPKGVRIHARTTLRADRFEPLRFYDGWPVASPDAVAEVEGLVLDGPDPRDSPFSGAPFATSHPSFQAFLVHAASRAVLEHHPNNAGMAVIGLGHMGVPDVPEYLDEAVFGVRSALRRVERDGRRGPPLASPDEANLVRALAVLDEATRRAAGGIHSRVNESLSARTTGRTLRFAMDWHRRRGGPSEDRDPPSPGRGA